MAATGARKNAPEHIVMDQMTGSGT
jgi:hypothetical protein